MRPEAASLDALIDQHYVDQRRTDDLFTTALNNIALTKFRVLDATFSALFALSQLSEDRKQLLYESLLDNISLCDEAEEIEKTKQLRLVFGQHIEHLKLSDASTSKVLAYAIKTVKQSTKDAQKTEAFKLLAFVISNNSLNGSVDLIKQIVALKPENYLTPLALKKLCKKLHSVKDKFGFPTDILKASPLFIFYRIFATSNLDWMKNPAQFSRQDWYTLLLNPTLLDPKNTAIFKNIFDIFADLALANPEQYAQLLFANINVLASDKIVRKLCDEKYFDFFFNRNALYKNPDLLKNIIQLFKKRPDLLEREINYENKSYKERIFFRIYNMGYKNELVDIIKSCPTFNVNLLHRNGFPLLLLACANNDVEIVDAIIAHPNFDPDVNLNALDTSSRHDTNILFYLANLMGRVDDPVKYATSFSKIAAQGNVDLKAYNSSSAPDKGNSILLVLANYAHECLPSNGESSKFHAAYCKLFEEVFEKVKDDYTFLKQLSNHGGKHDNILHAIAKMNNDTITKEVFTHYWEFDPQRSRTLEFNGYKEILHFLKTPNAQNTTPLEHAYLAGNTTFINKAFEITGPHAFDISKCSSERQFRLLVAAARGGNKEKLEELINKISFDTKVVRTLLIRHDAQGRNLLHHAANAEVLKYLIDTMDNAHAHFMIEQKDCDGVTPLLQHASSNNIHNVEVLIEYADVNTTDIKGNSPLITACSRGFVSMVELLTQVPNLDIDHKNQFGANALHAAASSKTVHEFLQSSPTLANAVPNSLSPQEIEKAQVEIIAILLDNKADISEYIAHDSHNPSSRNLLPALQTFVFTGLRHTLFSTINLFMMGTRENPVYTVMDTYNKLAFVFDAHGNIKFAVGAAIGDLLGQVLNYSVTLKTDVTFSNFYVSTNPFYTKITDTPPTIKKEEEAKTALTFTASAIGDAFKNVFRKIGLLPKHTPTQIGIVNKTESTKKIDKKGIEAFIANYSTNPCAEKEHQARLYLDTLFKNYLRLHKITKNRWLVIGANDILKDVKATHSALLEATKIGRNQNFQWHTQTDIKHFLEILSKDSSKRAFVLQHMTGKNFTEYANLETFMKLVINGKIHVNLDQYIAILDFHTDLSKTREHLNNPTFRSQVSGLFFARMLINSTMNWILERMPFYTFSDGNKCNILEMLKITNMQTRLDNTRTTHYFSRDNVDIQASKLVTTSRTKKTIGELKEEYGKPISNFITFSVMNFSFLTLASRFGNTLQLAGWASLIGTDITLRGFSLLIQAASLGVNFATTPITAVGAIAYGAYRYRDSIYNIVTSYTADERSKFEEIYEPKKHINPIAYSMVKDLESNTISSQTARTYEVSSTFVALYVPAPVINFGRAALNSITNLFRPAEPQQAR